MIANAVLFSLAYLCLVAAQSIYMLFAGRLLVGMASGITTIAAPTYVSEIASPIIRGMLGSFFQLMVTIGVLYVGVVGAFLSWRWLSVACLGTALLWAFLMLISPESPVYLLSKGDVQGDTSQNFKNFTVLGAKYNGFSTFKAPKITVCHCLNRRK